MGDRRYNSFLAVVDEGSFSEGARREMLTQPTVSRQVASLEKELGVRLLDRSGTAARLTEAGAVAEGYLRRICELERELRQSLMPFGGPPREHVVCCPDNMGTYDYATFRRVVQCAQVHWGPNVRVEPTPPPEALRTLLEEGKVNAAFALIEPTVGEGSALCASVLLTAPQFILCAEGHRLAGYAEVRPADLAGTTVLLPADDQQNTRLFADALSGADVRGVRFEPSPTTASMLALLGAGDKVGFSTFPIRDVGGVCCVPYRATRYFHLGLIWARDREGLLPAGFVRDVEAIYREEHPGWVAETACG